MQLLTDILIREKEIFSKVKIDDIRIAGSALYDPNYHDIDVFIDDTNDFLFAYLLHYSKKLNLHPIKIPKNIFNNLEDYLSWKNTCVITKLDGTIHFGKPYSESMTLQFNPISKTYFNSLSKVITAGKKLEKSMTKILPDCEVARASLHLTKNVQELNTILLNVFNPNIIQYLIDVNGIVAGGILRDEIQGKSVKDIDIFIPSSGDYTKFCEYLSKELKEIQFNNLNKKLVNVRKFKFHSTVSGYEDITLDVIDYKFVKNKEHITETFDFLHNMLWWDPATQLISGVRSASADEILDCILNYKLIVGDNLWFRAGKFRALKRWERFRRDGYTPDLENIRKYQEYMKIFFQ
jgi:hypothetical protein